MLHATCYKVHEEQRFAFVIVQRWELERTVSIPVTTHDVNLTYFPHTGGIATEKNWLSRHQVSPHPDHTDGERREAWIAMISVRLPETSSAPFLPSCETFEQNFLPSCALSEFGCP
jgi:hypothetical protein